jgi:transposase
MTLTMADLVSPSARTTQESTVSQAGPRADRAMPRTFTREYKLRMVAEYEAATEPGAKGALLRREGLYQSNVRKWREARDAGRLAARREDQVAASRKNARNTSAEMKRLRHEIERLEGELKKSRAVVEVMGKTYALLEMLSESAD